MRLATGWICLGLLLLGGCGGSAGESTLGEQEIYEAIARSDVRYALLTRADGTVETQSASGEIVRFTGVEDLDALAAVLSKEHIEHAVQETNNAAMRQ